MILELRNVNRIYETDGLRKQALKDITIKISSGDQIMILGASGSGKSTLLNIIGLLDKGYEGQYLIDGIERKTLTEKEQATLRSRLFGYVFQDFVLVENETIFENVRIPLIYSTIEKSKHKAMIETALEGVGLAGMSRKRVKYLSGGERQRVAIARALVNQPKIVIADEPTGSLDQITREQVLDIIYNYLDEDKILLFVTHDLENNRRGEQKIIDIKNGELFFD
ncbi:ABC transporter ATP-binding protein [Erysipelothrix larvae]|uniref:ABC transporter ATP-binding protein n=1 Tax=Erysipelothrix larvae TaxID=1514105 RepID=UPI00098FDCF4|nr:ABC transporter ATP-binding protein [Erysipelothrix larvae]